MLATQDVNKVSDIQYVKNYDEHIGTLYEEAKSSYIDAPIQTLVSLRSIVHEICKQLHDEYALKGVKKSELSQLINKLRDEKVVNGDVIRVMLAIKKAGDHAAHKHQPMIKITMDEYRAMSVNSTQDFCKLIEALYGAFSSDFTAPYFFESKVDSYLEKLSYKALIDNDKQAKFKVGTALIEMVIKSWSNTETSSATLQCDDGKISRGVKLIKEAADQRYPEAMFEYGVMLLTGEYINKDIEEALKFFYQAAGLQHNQAKAYYGSIIIDLNYSDEIPLAIDLLQEASEELNPYALTKLGELYANGDYVERDILKSTRLLEKAVSQNFPLAYYQLAVNDWNDPTKGFESSVALLKKSKEFGFFPASLFLARIYAAMAEYTLQAKTEYSYYLDLPHTDFSDYLEVLFEFEQFKYLREIQTLAEYLRWLASFYRQEQCTSDMARLIEVTTSQLLPEYRRLLISNNESLEDSDLLMEFLPNGIPHKSFHDMQDFEIKKRLSLAGNNLSGVEQLDKNQHANTEKAKELQLLESKKRQKEKSKRRKANKQKRKG